MALRALFNFFKREKESEKVSFTEDLKKAEQLTQQGKLEEALQEMVKIEQRKDLKEKDRLACTILKSSIFTQMGNYQEGLILADKALNESVKKGNNIQSIDAIISKADILFRTGKHLEAIAIIEEGEKILSSLIKADNIEILERQAYFKNRKGTIYWNKGNLSLGLENLHAALKIRERLENKQDVAATLNNIGLIYLNKGEYTKAFESFQNALGISEELKLDHYIAAILGNIGAIRQAKGEHEKAEEAYTKVLQIFQKLGNDTFTSEVIYRMITLSLEKSDAQKAKEYLLKLEEMRGKREDKIINQRTRLAKALILKTSDRTINKAEAQKIFNEITNEEVIDNELSVNAMLNLCDLLLLELKTYGNEEVLTEVENLVKKLLETAKQQNSYSLLIETYLLESKLALVQLDTRKAQKLLTQAQIIAEEQDLKKLALKTSNEHDNLLNQINKWENLIKRKASLNERLELAKLEDMLSKMISKKSEDLNEEAEEAVLILIMSESGLTLFSTQFIPEQQLNEHLIVGFLSAINIFCKETFCSTGSLERIKHEEYTILMKSLRNMIFSYVFKGQSYAALQKLDAFIELIMQDDKIIKDLETQAERGVIERENIKIAKIAREVFTK